MKSTFAGSSDRRRPLRERLPRRPRASHDPPRRVRRQVLTPARLTHSARRRPVENGQRFRKNSGDRQPSTGHVKKNDGRSFSNSNG